MWERFGNERLSPRLGTIAADREKVPMHEHSAAFTRVRDLILALDDC
jgi:hypothetical protein